MTPKTMTKPLLLALLLVAMLATAGQAPRCQLFPTRGRYSCWCYGAYGWTTAPMILCKLGGAS